MAFTRQPTSIVSRARPRRTARGERPTRHLPLRSIDRGGAATLLGGDVVRIVELTPFGALAAAGEPGDALHAGIARLLDGLSLGEELQWYVESRPVPTAELAPPPLEHDRPLAHLGAAEHAALLRQASSGLERFVHVILREPGDGGAVARAARAAAGRGPLRAAYERAHARSLARADALCGELDELGLRPRLLDGPGVSRLLLRRLHGDGAPAPERRAEVAGALDAHAEDRRSAAAAGRLLEHLRGLAIDVSGERAVHVGSRLEHAIALAGASKASAYAWLRAMLAVTQPNVVSIFTRAREDGVQELAAYQAIGAPGPEPDAVRLALAVDDVVRTAGAQGARIDRGEFSQAALWRSTLPLALDVAGIAHHVDTRAAAMALPLVEDRCGSPGGVPLGRGRHGLVERVDPWDAVHRQAAVLVAGGDAALRARVVLPLLARLALRGTRVVALDAEGALAAACGQLADGVSSRTARTPAEVLSSGYADAPLTVAAAAGATALLPLAGAVAARMGLPAGALGDEPPDDVPAGRAALVLADAERLLDEPGGADWLRRVAARTQRDGTCLVLLTEEPAPLAAAGLLPLLPLRILLAGAPCDDDAAAGLLALSAPERQALARAGDPAEGEAPLLLCLNGDRGRALLRLIELPQHAPPAVLEAA